MPARRTSTRVRRTSSRQGPRAPDALVTRMLNAVNGLVSAFEDRLMRKLEPLLRERFTADGVTLNEVFSETAGEQSLSAGFLGRMFRLVDRQAQTDLEQVPGIPVRDTLPNARKLEEQFVRANTDLIKLEERARREVETIVHSSQATALVSDVRKQIQERLGVVRSRAELIARDQTLKLYGQIQQERQTSAGIVEYTWSTSEDERVREDHALLDGTVQRWDTPPVVDRRTGRREHPGSDFQCRCSAVPILETALAPGETVPAPPPEPRPAPEPQRDLLAEAAAERARLAAERAATEAQLAADRARAAAARAERVIPQRVPSAPRVVPQTHEQAIRELKKYIGEVSLAPHTDAIELEALMHDLQAPQLFAERPLGALVTNATHAAEGARISAHKLTSGAGGQYSDIKRWGASYLAVHEDQLNFEGAFFSVPPLGPTAENVKHLRGRILDQVLTHEFGHAVHLETVGDHAAIDDIVRKVYSGANSTRLGSRLDDRIPNPDREIVSTYGEGNRMEYFAESYAAYQMRREELRSVAPSAFKMVEDVLRLRGLL